MKKLILLIFLFHTLFAYSQQMVDSLAIVKAFEKALSSKSQNDNPLVEAKILLKGKDKNNQFLDTYYLQWAKYLLLTGQRHPNL